MTARITRAVAVAVACVAGVAGSLAAERVARADTPTYGDYVKAARMLQQWRYDEATELVAGLAARAPDAEITRYLRAELAFLRGRYQESLDLLGELEDDAVQGSVGQLRPLVQSTLAVTGGFATYTSSGGHFVIAYPPGKDELIVDLAGDVLEAAYARIGEDFGHHPREVVRVELLDRPEDLAQLSTLTATEIKTTGTIALCKYGKLMVVSPRATLFGYEWMDTLVHEYVHYVVSQASHDTVPVWLHEGLARFEQTRWRADPAVSLGTIDEHLLASALKHGDLVSFDDMHPSMAKLPSAEAAALAFAEVYTMVGFVHEQVGYDGIRRIVALSRDGRSARRAVAEVVGGNWDDVERAWKKHLRKQNLQMSTVVAGRAKHLGIRFDGPGGGDDTENVGIEEVADDKAAKLARLGGMLRARGMSAAAAVEYEKALEVLGRPDPFISAKLARTYLEVERYDRAIEIAEVLLAADDGDAGPPTTLGVAYLATGAADKAAEAFEMALRISPFDPSVRCGLADAYATLNKPALARREQRACSELR